MGAERKVLGVRCSRNDKCQNEFKVKEHYADFFKNFNDRFKLTVIDPNVTANANIDYVGVTGDDIRSAMNRSAATFAPAENPAHKA